MYVEKSHENTSFSNGMCKPETKENIRKFVSLGWL